MAHFYVAGPLFSPHERAALERVDDWLRAAGHSTFLPHRDAGDTLGCREKGAEDRARLFASDWRAVREADAVVALLDGPDVDSGTAVEVGAARAWRKPVLGIRRDLRTLGPEGAVNLMVEHSCTRFLHRPGASDDEVRVEVLRFASEVAESAGTLVRDGVPRLAEERKAALGFRRAGPAHLPTLLKARVVEEAEALAGAAEAEELEEVADLLEALEALCRARGIDRETLKAAKGAKWKRKGGFDEGWVLVKGTAPSRGA